MFHPATPKFVRLTCIHNISTFPHTLAVVQAARLVGVAVAVIAALRRVVRRSRIRNETLTKQRFAVADHRSAVTAARAHRKGSKYWTIGLHFRRSIQTRSVFEVKSWLTTAPSHHIMASQLWFPWQWCRPLNYHTELVRNI